MDVETVQGRMDDLSRAMLAKGLRNPNPQFHIEAYVAPCVFLQWGVYNEPDYRVELIRDPDHYQAIADAFALIEGLPSAEEAKRQQFMASLAKVIDLGRENGIEVDFLNPLAETMKRLSENALTDQRQKAFDEAFGDLPTPAPSDYSDANTEDFDDGNITP